MRSKEYIITSAMLLLIMYTLSLSLVSQAFPAGQTSRSLSSTGTIQIQATEGIGIYSNSQCTTPQSTISWGTLQQGGSKNVILYIKNEGSTPTTLALQSSNWSPSTASNYLTLGWNYNNQPISAGSSIAVTLTLTVSASITGITNFAFDITVGST
jgi:hypothetical protein